VLIRNNGDDDIKLLKGTSIYPDMLVHEQLYLFPNIPVQEEKDMLAGHGILGGQPSRTTIKDQVDFALQNSENVVTLKKGESLTINFDNREISASVLSFTRNRIPFSAELYLPPNDWIPVEVNPPIAIACDAKLTPVVAENSKHKKGKAAAWVFRVRMDTNEFLYARSNFSTHRLLDVHPDDTVVLSNQTITVKQNTGGTHIISERDIPQMLDKRRNEKRKKTK
jgi:hypothetical protein